MSEENVLKKQNEQNRSIAIVACLDAKQAFELYSYRIIDHQAFIDKMVEIGGTLSQITLIPEDGE